VPIRITSSRTLFALAFCAAALSCARTPPRADGLPAPSALPARLDAIAAALGAQGYSPVSWLEADLSTGRGAALSFEAHEDARAAAVAVGAPETLSLDLHVRNAATGEVIAKDVSRGRRAVAAFAARAGESYELSVSAVSGEGRASLAAFGAPPDAPPPALQAFFDAEAAGRLTWAGIEETLSREGFAPDGAPVDIALDGGSRSGFSFALRAGRCYEAVVLGSPGVDAVGLRLYAGSELVSGDFAGRYSAWAAFCPERDLEIRAALGDVDGAGSARLGLFSAPAENVRASVGPPVRASQRPKTAEAALGVEASLLSRRGYGPGRTVAELADLEAGERRPVPLPVAGPGCFAVVAATAEDGVDLDLGLALSRPGADGGDVVLEDFATGATSMIAVCGGAGVTAAATVLSMRACPRALVAVFPLAGEAPAPGAIDTDSAFREAAARFAREGLTRLLARIALAPCDGGFCGAARLDGGTCYGATALVRAGRAVRLAVEDSGDGNAVRRGGDGVTELAFCADKGGERRFSVSISGGDGAPPSLALFAEARDKTAPGK
jgi:hypothetical protein